jgi:hypothetical protein
MVLVLAVALVSALVFRGRAQALGRAGADAPVARAGSPGGGLGGVPDPPRGIFPSQWLAGADEGKLGPLLAKARDEAARAFFDGLGPLDDGAGRPPDPGAIEAAAGKMAFSLRQSLASPGVLGALSGGGGLGRKETALLILHLGRLLPPVKAPRPEAQPGEIRPLAVALVALAGSAVCSLAGGTVRFLGLPAETGHFVGSALGAGLGALVAMFLSQNERCRRWLMAAVGGLAFLDALSAIVGGALLPGFLSSGRGSLAKRLLFYLGAMLVLALVKGGKGFDRERLRRDVEERAGDYLRDSLPLLAVLMFRVGGEGQGPALGTQPGEALAADVAALVRRLRGRGWAGDDPVMDELARRLARDGYDTEPRAGVRRRLAWEDGLGNLYETFGLIGKDQMVVIEEEPVLREGKVVQKGLAVPE